MEWGERAPRRGALSDARSVAAPLALALLAGCSAGGLPFGSRCGLGADCASSLCLSVWGDVGRCISRCKAADDCPTGWTCDEHPAVSGRVCLCAATGEAERCG